LIEAIAVQNNTMRIYADVFCDLHKVQATNPRESLPPYELARFDATRIKRRIFILRKR
jgi:hypothetical protein